MAHEVEAREADAIRYENELCAVRDYIQRLHGLGAFKHIGLLECAAAMDDIESDYNKMRSILVKLLDASKTVLAGLNARIDAADGKHVPVFNGITDIHDAIHEAQEIVCYRTFDCANGDHSDCCPAK